MLSEPNWCSRGIFWGSHGCDKGDHTDDIHECHAGPSESPEVCSQLRIVDEHSAEVRFLHGSSGDKWWGLWQGDWTWFAQEPRLPGVLFTEPDDLR